MPRINDDILFPPTQAFAGCTWIGSLPNGTTVQFSYEGMILAAKGDLDVIHYATATREGQTVVANQDSGAIDFPSINGGRLFQGVINTWPPTIRAHFDMIFEKI